MSMTVILGAARGRRFSIPDRLVTCFAAHDGIPAVARAAWRQKVLGGIPTCS
jgi:hypothetical protein